MTVKDHIRGVSQFRFYKKGHLWYETMDTGFLFPVPIEDVGDGVFGAQEKSLLMMRYIRKLLAEAEKA